MSGLLTILFSGFRLTKMRVFPSEPGNEHLGKPRKIVTSVPVNIILNF